MFTGRALLFYSGGKDSIALLHVMRSYLDRCLVIWVNTGDPLPEVRDHMASVSQSVPGFREIRSDVHADIKLHGYPADISPVAMGRSSPLKIRPWDQCCHSNLWLPTQHLLNECRGEYGTIIRGQKNTDRLRATTHSGQHIDGYEILYPLENWTDKEVFDYIEENKLDLPAHYAQFSSSIDCWACTAHTQDNHGKLGYLMKHHPQLGRELGARMQIVIREIDREMVHVRQFMESA